MRFSNAKVLIMDAVKPKVTNLRSYVTHFFVEQSR